MQHSSCIDEPATATPAAPLHPSAAAPVLCRERQVEEIFAVVEAAARSASPPEFPPACVCGGSYRRGKPTSGDVDVVMTNNNENVRRVILPKMLEIMRQQGASGGERGKETAGGFPP